MPPKQRKTRNNRRNASPPVVEETTEQIINRRVAEAIAQYEATRNRDDRGSGTRNTEPIIIASNPENTQRGCSYKNFLACKPSNFNGTEGAIGIIHWIEKMESVLDISNCSRDCMVKYATCTLADKALTWWNAQVQALGRTTAHSLSWEDLKAMIMDEFCPRSELQKIEMELWNIMMIGADVTGYTTRFQELARLVPHMVTPEYKRIERYTWGLVPQIRSLVTSSRPATFKSAVELAQSLTDEAVRMGTLIAKTNSGIGAANNTEDRSTRAEKREWDGDDYQDRDQQLVKRPETAQAYITRSEDRSNYGGHLPYCSNCDHHHQGPCSAPCANCKLRGHLAQDCRFPTTTTNPNAPRTCFECGDTGHFMRDCPERQD